MEQFDRLVTKEYIVSRKEFYIRLYNIDLHSPMVADSIRFIKDLDHHFGISMLLMAEMATGETTEESKMEKIEFEFKVFNTWWDHFKFKVKENRFWLSKLVIFKNKIKVEYRSITKIKEISYPIKIVRACPHINEPFKGKSHLHLSYLFPNEFKKHV